MTSLPLLALIISFALDGAGKRNVHAKTSVVEEERAWTLDGAGDWASLRITPKNKPATTLTQQVNSLNAYTGFGGTTQVEDFDGNKQDDGRFTYKWDFLHRLRTVHCKAGGELVSSHLYDASGANGMLNGSGRRVRKIVTQDRHGCSGSRREAADLRYLFDGIQIIEEKEGQKTVRQYVHGARLDEHLTMDVYKSNGKLDESFFYQEDGKGWVVALTDKKGKVQERYSYDAYGMPSFLGEDSKPIKNQSGSALGNPFLYNGGYFDSETGLYCSRHRMYAPAQGRFYSRDPIGIWGDGIGLGNGYAYCGGNALNGWDPEGLDDQTKEKKSTPGDQSEAGTAAEAKWEPLNKELGGKSRATVCVFDYSTGVLCCTNGRMTICCKAFSGNGPNVNDPNAQDLVDHGPLPEGEWLIGTEYTPSD